MRSSLPIRRIRRGELEERFGCTSITVRHLEEEKDDRA